MGCADIVGLTMAAGGPAALPATRLTILGQPALPHSIYGTPSTTRPLSFGEVVIFAVAVGRRK